MFVSGKSKLLLKQQIQPTNQQKMLFLWEKIVTEESNIYKQLLMYKKKALKFQL